MDVVALAPVPVASYYWRLGDRPWTLTLVCKLTLDLEPGEATLAKENEPIHLTDTFIEDDVDASPYGASDLTPGKPLVDVMLVGDAFAPRGKPTQSLTARLKVGSLDKSVLVAAQPGAGPFARAPLDYRLMQGASSLVRATHPAGGDVRLIPVAGSDGGTGETMAAFGPISPQWPQRNRLLRGLTDPSPQADRAHCELPSDFDLRFFNAAPPDQQLMELEVGSELVLDNLHPTHQTLSTRLPKLQPQMFVQRRSGSAEREEIPCHIHTLWIDTRRSLLTITWRGELQLEAPDQPGKIWVVLAGQGKRLNTGGLSRLIHSLGGPDEPESERDPMAQTVSIRAHRAADSEEATETSVLDRSDLEAAFERTADVEALIERTSDSEPDEDYGAPPWLARASSPGDRKSVRPPPLPSDAAPASGAVPAGSPPSYRPTPSEYGRTSSPPPAPVSLSAQSPARPVPALRPPLATQRGLGLAPRPPVPQPPASLPAVSPPPGNNAARGVLSRNDNLDDTASLPDLRAKVAAAAQSDLEGGVELLWFDRNASERLRRSWQRLCDELDFAPRDPSHDLASSDAALRRDHHQHFGVLTQARSGDYHSLEPTWRDALGAMGHFTPPMVLLEGTLRFHFDALEHLKAMAAMMRPITKGDRKMFDALAQVDELETSPVLGGDSRTVASIADHLRKNYRASRRALSLDYIEQASRRAVLEGRHYTTRTLFGSEQIRALCDVKGGDTPVPTYLPKDLALHLPLLSQLDARLIAELHVRQDQFEKHPFALKVVTLGRLIAFD